MWIQKGSYLARFVMVEAASLPLISNSQDWRSLRQRKETSQLATPAQVFWGLGGIEAPVQVMRFHPKTRKMVRVGGGGGVDRVWRGGAEVGGAREVAARPP